MSLPHPAVDRRGFLGRMLGGGAAALAATLPRALEDIRYEGWIMVERDSRERDYVRSARHMRAVLRRFGS